MVRWRRCRGQWSSSGRGKAEIIDLFRLIGSFASIERSILGLLPLFFNAPIYCEVRSIEVICASSENSLLELFQLFCSGLESCFETFSMQKGEPVEGVCLHFGKAFVERC